MCLFIIISILTYNVDTSFSLILEFMKYLWIVHCLGFHENVEESIV